MPPGYRAGLLSLAGVVTTHVLWVHWSGFSPSADEGSFLIYSVQAYQRLHAGASSLINEYFHIIEYRPPLISLQALPFFALTSNLAWISIAGQFVWLAIMGLSCFAFERGSRALLAAAFILLTPYVAAQVRQNHTDLGAAALAFAFYACYERSSRLTRTRWVPLMGMTAGLGCLMRPEFPVYVLPVFVHAWFLRGRGAWLKNVPMGLAVVAIAAAVAGPWYYANWIPFARWFRTNSARSEFVLADYAATRFAMAGYFALGALSSNAGLIGATIRTWTKSATSRFARSRALWRVPIDNFVLCAGIYQLLFALIANYFFIARTRNLIAAVPLIVVGLLRLQSGTEPRRVSGLALAWAWGVYLFFSFVFMAPAGRLNAQFNIVNAIPRRPLPAMTLAAPLGRCLERVKGGGVGRPRYILVQGTDLFSYEGMAAVAVASKSPFFVVTDLYTKDSDLDGLYNDCVCFFLPDARYTRFGFDTLGAQRTARLRIYLAGRQDITADRPVDIAGTYGIDVYYRK